MTCVRRNPWKAHRLGCLLSALVFVLAWGGEATASSVTAAPEFDAEAHAHFCKCGTCRGASCCCGPKRESKSQPPAPRPASKPDRTDAGPCVDSAPCSDPGIPSAPTAGPSGRAATLPVLSPVGPQPAGRFLPVHAALSSPDPRSSRLDDPPEMPALA